MIWQQIYNVYNVKSFHHQNLSINILIRGELLCKKGGG